MTVAPDLSHRRTRVRQLKQDGASLRDIATAVGVSKDTVARDLTATETAEETLSQRLAHRASHTKTAMRQLSDAAQAVNDATPAHTITDDATAQRWARQLRDTAAQLSRAADAFATYYPAAVASDTETGVAS